MEYSAPMAFLVISALLATRARSQDMGDMGDDGGGGGGDDMSDVMDPTMLGMGSDDGGLHGLMGYGVDGEVTSLDNLKVQSLLALQELGIVVGVAFMVAGIFLLMVYMEKLANNILSRYQKRFGNPTEEDVEDPAALVGTFKRYKN